MIKTSVFSNILSGKLFSIAFINCKKLSVLMIRYIWVYDNNFMLFVFKTFFLYIYFLELKFCLHAKGEMQ